MEVIEETGVEVKKTKAPVKKKAEVAEEAPAVEKKQKTAAKKTAEKK